VKVLGQWENLKSTQERRKQTNRRIKKDKE
jgi:hypothetical protein